MYYTIASLEDVQGVLRLNFDKQGNKYTIGLYNNETKEYTHNTFDDMDDAYEVFEKLSKWIIFSYYSEKSKRQFLLTGTI